MNAVSNNESLMFTIIPILATIARQHQAASGTDVRCSKHISGAVTDDERLTGIEMQFSACLQIECRLRFGTVTSGVKPMRAHVRT
jgi:hypothetical protein